MVVVVEVNTGARLEVSNASLLVVLFFAAVRLLRLRFSRTNSSSASSSERS